MILYSCTQMATVGVNELIYCQCYFVAGLLHVEFHTGAFIGNFDNYIDNPSRPRPFTEFGSKLEICTVEVIIL